MTGHLSQPIFERFERIAVSGVFSRLKWLLLRQRGGLFLIFLLAAIALVVRYLSEGQHVLTTSPSAAHVSKCRKEMHIAADAQITPLGIKMLDTWWNADAIWFRFHTTTPLAQLFDARVVDVSAFDPQFYMGIGATRAEWWDVAHERLPGGEVQLNDDRTLSIAVRKTPRGHMVYIFWYEN